MKKSRIKPDSSTKMIQTRSIEFTNRIYKQDRIFLIGVTLVVQAQMKQRWLIGQISGT